MLLTKPCPEDTLREGLKVFARRYLPQDPVLFCALATVNKTFYAAFTSDEVWELLDVYNLKKGIFKDFMARLPSFQGIMRACWHQIELNKFDITLVENNYAQLGYYLKGKKDPPYNRFASFDTTYPDPDASATMLSTEGLWDYGAHIPMRMQDEPMWLHSTHKIFAPENRILELVLEIDPSRFAAFSSELRNDYRVSFKACLMCPDNLKHCFKAKSEICFVVGVVARAAKFGYSGDGFITPSMSTDIKMQAFKVCANTLSTNGRYNTALNDIQISRNQLLRTIRGNPHLLALSAWQKDREILLTALEPGRNISVEVLERTLGFLANSDDKEVILKAVMNFPETVVVIPPKYRSKTLVGDALERSDWKTYLALLKAKHLDFSVFKDGHILATCMDKGYLEKAPYPNADLMGHVCNQFGFMKGRVVKRPSSWNHAGEHLKTNHPDLLKMALDANVVVKPTIKTFEDTTALLYLDPSNAHFNRSQRYPYGNATDLNSEAFNLHPLPPRPVNSQGKLTKYPFEDKNRLRGTKYFQSDIITYGEHVREGYWRDHLFTELFLADPRQLLKYRSKANKYLTHCLQTPEMKPHLYDIDLVEQHRGHLKTYLEEEGRPDWNQIDRASAMRLFQKFPTLLLNLSDKWIDTAFIAEAVQTNGRLFSYIEPKFQQNKMVQQAIGPFREKINEDMNVRNVALGKRTTPVSKKPAIAAATSSPQSRSISEMHNKVFGNVRILEIIASNITPDPVLFCRLASLNKTFKAVFTLDTIWRRLDIYNVKHDIYQDFIRRLPTYQQLMRMTWNDPPIEGLDMDLLAENKYAALGYYVRGSSDPPYDPAGPQNISENNAIELTQDELWRFGCIERPEYKEVTPDDAEWLTCEASKLSRVSNAYWLQGNPAILGASNRMLELVLEVDPRRFERLSYTLLKEWPICQKGCLQRPENLIFSGYDCDPDFVIGVIARCHKYGYTGNGFITRESPPEAIMHALEVCPSTLDPTEYFRREAEDLERSRELFLRAVVGRPQNMEYFYFRDKESILLALEPGPSIPVRALGVGSNFYMHFLKTCTDKDVIAKALKFYPETVLILPPEYRRETATLQHVLARVDGDVYRVLIGAADLDLGPYRNAETLAICMDRGHLDYGAYPDRAIYERMGRQLEWMKERVLARPSSWHHASEPLRRTKDMFMLAMRENIRRKQCVQDPDDLRALLVIKEMVPGFWKNELTFQLAEEAFCMGNLPEWCKVNMKPCLCNKEAWFRWVLETNQEVCQLVSMGVFLELFERDLRLILRYRHHAKLMWRENRTEYWKSRIYEIDFVERFRQNANDRRSSILYVKDKPNWKRLDRASALGLFKLFPTLSRLECSPFMNTDFAVDAVKANGRLFVYLDPEYQRDPRVRMAIGRLGEEINENMDIKPLPPPQKRRYHHRESPPGVWPSWQRDLVSQGPVPMSACAWQRRAHYS